MASAGVGTPGSGRRRSLDAEINLVPFIDLLSMCICFLLMTAVWIELGGVSVKQATGTAAPTPPSSSFEMDVRWSEPTALEIGVKSGGASTQTLRLQAASDADLQAQLKAWLEQFASRIPGEGASSARLAQAVSAVRLTTKAGVSYGQMVGVMDAFREKGLINIGVTPVKD